MRNNGREIVILAAEDDPDDQLLLREAFEENGFQHRIEFVENGSELIAYLQHQGKYEDTACAPRPDLILLDLNMPVKDGRTALKEIKSDPALRTIPIVVLTTSGHEDDIMNAYSLGASSFIKKPGSFSAFSAMIRRFSVYWLRVATIPPQALSTQEAKRSTKSRSFKIE